MPRHAALPSCRSQLAAQQCQSRLHYACFTPPPFTLPPPVPRILVSFSAEITDDGESKVNDEDQSIRLFLSSATLQPFSSFNYSTHH